MTKFVKLLESEETEFLIENHPHAFLLLSKIALRARIFHGQPDGLEKGECYIGDHHKYGLTRQEYRTALNILTIRSHIKIIENCRTRKKSTTGVTTYGTKVKILRSDVYDLNLNIVNHPTNHRPTTDQPPTNHEQERTRKKEIEKESTTMQPSAVKEVVVDSLDIEKMIEQLKEHPECKERKIFDITAQSISMFTKYPRERILLAIEFCKNSHIDKTLGATMMWHLKLREPIKPRGFKMSPDDNRLYAIKTLDKVKYNLKYTIDVYGKYVELVNGAMILPTIGYDNHRFKEEFDEWIHLYAIDNGTKQLNGIANGILENLTCKT